MSNSASDSLEALQSAALAHSLDGVAMGDQNGDYIYVNDSMVRIYGYDSAQEIIGNPWHLFYGEPEISKFEQDIMPTLLREGKWRGELEGKRKDGTRFPKEISLSVTGSGWDALH